MPALDPVYETIPSQPWVRLDPSHCRDEEMLFRRHSPNRDDNRYDVHVIHHTEMDRIEVTIHLIGYEPFRQSFHGHDLQAALEWADSELESFGVMLSGPSPRKFIQEHLDEKYLTPVVNTTAGEVMSEVEAQSTGDRLKNAAKDIGDAAFTGTKMALANEANERIRLGVRKALGDAYPKAWEDNQIIQAIEAMILPSALIIFIDMYPQLIPKADLVKKGAELAMTAAVEKHASMLLQLMIPALGELARIGEEYEAVAALADMQEAKTKEKEKVRKTKEKEKVRK